MKKKERGGRPFFFPTCLYQQDRLENESLVLGAKSIGGRKKSAIRCASSVALCFLAYFVGSLAADAQASNRRYDFDIAAVTLGDALEALVEVTGAQLIYPDSMASRTGVNPVLGEHTTEEALNILLEGTEFSGGLTSGGVIVISLREKTNQKSGEDALTMQLDKKTFLAGAAVLALNGQGDANAQNDTRDLLSQEADVAITSTEDQAKTLDIVTVTTRRREESLLDVPESITVFSAQMIEDLEIDEISDFAQMTPGVNVQQGFTAGDRPLLAFRGIGAFGGTAPAVIIMSDGIYSPLGEPLRQGLFDVERIEVVKGPQGSVYGRDTIGGVINVVTARPGNEYEFRAKASYESRSNEKSLAVAANVPLIPEKLTARVSSEYLISDGFFDNALGLEHDTRDEYSGRLRLYATPSDVLSLDFRAGISKYENGGYNASFFAPDDDTTIEDVGTLAAVDLADGFRKRDVFDLALRADIQLGFAELTSLTQYVDAENTMFQDADLSLAPGLELTRLSEIIDRNWSQELRLVSPADQRFRWIAGVFYESGDFDYFDVDEEIAIPLGQLTSNRNEVDSQRYSVFGQIDYDLTDSLTISTALRYDDDTRDQTISLPSQSTQSIGFSRLTPKVSLIYSFSDNLTAYATYGEGFRSGGFDASTALPFDTEKLKSYEIGAKANLFSGRLATTIAGYRIDLTDQQLAALTTVPGSGALTTTTVNLGESQSYGLEFSAQANITDGLNVNFGIDVLDPEILASPMPEVIGNRTQLSTEYTLTLGGQYRHDISNSLSVVGRVDYYHQGNQYWNDANTLKQDPYGLLSARVAIEADAWTLALSGENLLDEEYNDQIFEFVPGLNAVYPGLASRLRVTATMRF